MLESYYKPTIIAQILSSQSRYIDRVYGQMFYYIDSNRLYYDTSDGNRVLANNIYITQYERERAIFTPPSSGYSCSL